MEKVIFEKIGKLFKDQDYVFLGHGTGRTGDDLSVVESIFEKGLRTKDNSLYYTTIGLDVNSNLIDKFHNWEHMESKKIILIRLPIKYINIYGDSADLNGEKFGAFYNEIDGKYYLDPRFIVGCFDCGTDMFIINDKFEKNLSKETISFLNNNYKETLKRTKERFKRQEESLNTLFGGNITK